MKFLQKSLEVTIRNCYNRPMKFLAFGKIIQYVGAGLAPVLYLGNHKGCYNKNNNN